MRIDTVSHVPIFEQIVAHFRQAIAAGDYLPGATLPSVRATALRCLVNPNTVQRAYQQLEREGLIETRKGRGALVTSAGGAAAQRLTADAVESRFVEGVDIGRAAGIENERLDALFQRALRGDGGAGRGRSARSSGSEKESRS